MIIQNLKIYQAQEEDLKDEIKQIYQFQELVNNMKLPLWFMKEIKNKVNEDLTILKEQEHQLRNDINEMIEVSIYQVQQADSQAHSFDIAEYCYPIEQEEYDKEKYVENKYSHIVG